METTERAQDPRAAAPEYASTAATGVSLRIYRTAEGEIVFDSEAPGLRKWERINIVVRLTRRQALLLVKDVLDARD